MFIFKLPLFKFQLEKKNSWNIFFFYSVFISNLTSYLLVRPSMFVDYELKNVESEPFFPKVNNFFKSEGFALNIIVILG